MKADQRKKRRLFPAAHKFVSVITLIFFSAGNIFALPVGQQVVNGQAAFNIQGNNLTITNSPNSIINWQGFSINANEAVRFVQQYGSSAVLNRVIGQDLSRILGLLQSNGRVFLINPNGILFGQGARIDVNGLFASTLNISNQDFLAGKYNFTAGAVAGSIQNQGTMRTPEGGKIYLIAPDIENSGIINSPKGDVILAAGHSVQLVDSLDPDISVVVSAPADKSVNLGQIVAQSGKVGIYGGLISQRGIVNADSAVVGENGMIIFKAKNDITLDAGSAVSAKGGNIQILGGREDGTVKISGTLDASASNGGDGGFIETSAAHVRVDDSARITTFAPYGKTGTWFIDPKNYTIAVSDGDMTGAALSSILSGSDVSILSSSGATIGSGDININDAVSWSANTLTLTAARDININEVMTAAGTSALAMNTATVNGSDAGMPGSTVKVGFNPDGSFKGRIDFPGRSGSGFLTINGNGYTVINSLGSMGSTTGTDLQGMNGNLSGYYALGSDIDASATSVWNSKAGFNPIGGVTWGNAFFGTFEGGGHVISNLKINTPNDYVGLFGCIDGNAGIRNVGLSNGSVTGRQWVGGLVGLNYSSSAGISNSYATTIVNGTGDSIGGLVGENNGSISNSYATGNVNGNDNVGGLVGFNWNTLDNSYATGTVMGNTSVGGLAGRNGGSGWKGSISNSYSTGSVNGNYCAGGLVGINYNSISNSYSTGAVVGTTTVYSPYMIGGLVGYNSDGTISNSFSTSTVSGSGSAGAWSDFGGLVGNNGSIISNSYSSGSVTGMNNVGGLVGYNSFNISNSYATGSVNGTGTSLGGLVGYNYGMVSNSYAAGSVVSMAPIWSDAGGLVGQNGGTISNSYATGSVSGADASGGLVGTNQTTGVVNNSFWDMTTSSTTISAIGTGLLTPDMKKLSTFSSWDIDDIGGTGKTWRIYDTNSYPLLRNFLTPLSVTANGAAKTYDGNIYSGGNGVSYSPLGYDSSKVSGTVTYSGTSQGAAAAGSYNIRPGSLYSTNQQGYDISFLSGTLTIDPRPLNISGVIADNKVYDGTTAATLSSIGTLSNLAKGETLTLNGPATILFDSKNVGSGKTVTASGYTISDGSGLVSNYTFNPTAATTADITARGLTVTAATNSKGYDGNISALARPTITSGSLAGGDTATLTEVYDSRIAGTGKTLTPAAVISDGNSGKNYLVNYVNNTTGVIDPGQIISGKLDVATGGKTIDFVVNGMLLPDQASTDASGNYSLMLPLNSIPNNSTLLAYVANDSIVKSASVFLVTGGDITNLLLSPNIVTASSGGGVMSNTTLGLAKGILSSSDIPYSVIGTDLTLIPNFNFKTASGTTYSINGNITTTNGAQAYNGPVTLLRNAVISAGTGNISFGGPVTGTGYNFTLNSQGTVTQTAPISVSGLELLGTGATYDLTNAGNTITTLSGNTGTVNFTNSAGIDIGTVNTAGFTTTGNFTLHSGGAITQSAPLQVAGVATFGAGVGNDITLMNAGNSFSSVGITSGKDVSVTDTGALALNASAVNNNFSATAGGDLTLNGLISAGEGAGTGNVTLSSGGAIINGMGSSMSIAAGYFSADAVNGIGSGDPLMTGVNKVTALNTTANNIEIDNTGILTISGLRNLGTGNVILQNIGKITTDASTVTSSGGTVSITAHSPLTIGAGGVSASGDISLEASPSSGSDDATINGDITSSNGNIILRAGRSIVINPGISLSAPNGTITLHDGTAASTGTGNSASTGNQTAIDNTVSSLMTAMGKITSSEKSDDDQESKKKTKESGAETTNDKKKDDSAKNYCN